MIYTLITHDFAKNVDTQLERALAETLRLIEERPSLEPQPGDRPQLGRKVHLQE